MFAVGVTSGGFPIGWYEDDDDGWLDEHDDLDDLFDGIDLRRGWNPMSGPCATVCGCRPGRRAAHEPPG